MAASEVSGGADLIADLVGLLDAGVGTGAGTESLRGDDRSGAVEFRVRGGGRGWGGGGGARDDVDLEDGSLRTSRGF